MKRSVFLLIAVITAFLLSGCRFVRIEEEERKPVAYTVVEKSDIPEELSRIMEEKKEKQKLYGSVSVLLGLFLVILLL